MVDAVTPPTAGSGLISVRSVAPQIANEAQTATTIKAQVGQMVSGTIFGMDQSGEPLLKSEQGDLALKLPFHLPSGTDVVLRMEAAPGGGMRARILSIDGQPPKDYEAGLAQNPNDGLLTKDSVSLTPNLARNAALATTPQQQTQQIALLPGETNPAYAQRTAELRTLLSNLPLPKGAPETPSPPQLGTLLSRSPELPDILQQLPANFPLPARLQPGAGLLLQVVDIQNPAQAPAPAQIGAPTPANAPFAARVNAAGFTQPPAMQSPQSAQWVTPLEATLPPAEPAAINLPALPNQMSQAPLAQATLQNALAATSGEALLHAPAAPTPPQNPTSLPAQVIGLEPNGDALLHTPLGIVRLPQNPAAPMVEGARVELQWLGAQEGAALPAVTNQPALASSGGWLPLTDRWASLDDTVALLAAVAAPGMPPIPRLPQPGAHMGADMLFFLAALQEGDLMPWIGRNAANQLTGKGRQDLLQRLGEDFTALGQPLMNSPSTQWQALLFPVWAEGQINQARLFVGRHPQEEKEKAEGRVPDTRFVLELTLSSLGDMQLCGLVRKPQPQATQFDLIIRSKRELSPPQRADIQGIFESGAELTGYKGQILFQHSPHFPDQPLESFKASGAGLMA